MFRLIIVLAFLDAGRPAPLALEHHERFASLADCMAQAAETSVQASQDESIIAMQATCQPAGDRDA